MRPIKIVGSDTDLHDYQVRIHLDRSNFPLEKCKPDGSDIRFRDDSGEILPYWIERWNAAEGVIWCKMPFIPAESSKFIWMIYGNPNAKSESNGNAVFELFNVQGIVGFWHMDEPQWTGATGEVKDETGVNHGIAHGGATTTSDAKYGRAGYFAGGDDYVEVPYNDSLNTKAITVELWYKADSLEDWDVLVARGLWGAQKPFLLGFGSNKQLWSKVVTTDGDSATYWGVYGVTNEWTHVAFTYDAINGMKTYVNAESKNTADAAGDIDCSYTTRLTIGTPDNLASFFNGRIDELRIWERALTPTEIKILYKNYMQKMGSYFNVRKYVTPAPVVIV